MGCFVLFQRMSVDSFIPNILLHGKWRQKIKAFKCSQVQTLEQITAPLCKRNTFETRFDQPLSSTTWRISTQKALSQSHGNVLGRLLAVVGWDQQTWTSRGGWYPAMNLKVMEHTGKGEVIMRVLQKLCTVVINVIAFNDYCNEVFRSFFFGKKSSKREKNAGVLLLSLKCFPGISIAHLVWTTDGSQWIPPRIPIPAVKVTKWRLPAVKLELSEVFCFF